MSKSRLIWPINPFADEKTYFKHALKVIGEFAAASGLQVEPVYVLSPPGIILPTGYVLDKMEPAEPKVKAAWEALTKGSKYAGSFLPPTVLTDASLSKYGMSRAVVDYAKTVGAEALAVATHGRKGAARFVMGSFAESLLHAADLPLFVFNPCAEKAGRTRKILFPVELPLSPTTPVDQVIQFAKASRAKLVFFHKVDYLNQFTAEPLFQMPTYRGYLEQDLTARRDELSKLLSRSRSCGVVAEAILDQGTAYVPDGILATARKQGVDLIAMVSGAGRVQSALLGSVTRQVLRTAKQPVWVVHPEPVAARQTIFPKIEVVTSRKARQ